MANLSPFLQKLQLIVKTTPKNIGDWSEDGTEYKVFDTKRFELEVLINHFKGSLLTFIRQLHFYCFKKLNHANDVWGFAHPKFLRDSPHLIFEIKRKTRNDHRGGAPASKLELDMVRCEMGNMRKLLNNELGEVKEQLQILLSNIHDKLFTFHLPNLSVGMNVLHNKNMPNPLIPKKLSHKKRRLSEDKSHKSSHKSLKKRQAMLQNLDFYNSVDTQNALFALNKLSRDGASELSGNGSIYYLTPGLTMSNPNMVHYGK